VAQDGKGGKGERQLDQDRAECQEQDFVLCLPIHDTTLGYADRSGLTGEAALGARSALLASAQCSPQALATRSATHDPHKMVMVLLKACSTAIGRVQPLPKPPHD
jgi:hypothetical protein